MKYLSPLISQGSGKLAGMVAAHNRGGLYFRNWRKPSNPNTPQQVAVRNNLTQLANTWGTLSTTIRNAWYEMAENMTFPGALGNSIKYSGQNCFNMCNLPRLQASLAVITTAPSIYEMAQLTLPVPTITAAGTTVSVAFTPADAWANEVGGALLVYGSRIQNSARIFFDGPYRFAGKVLGAASPPTSPAVITLPFPSGPSGSKQFFKFNCVRADGRISSAFRAVGTA